MKIWKSWVMLVLLSFLVPFSLGAQEQASKTSGAGRNGFTVEPYLKVKLGYTNYVLLATGIKSKLEFPLNSLVLGGRYRYAVQSGGVDEWRFQLSAETTVAGPWGLMKDHDWYVFSGYPPVKFSYTESEVEMAYFDINTSFEKRLFSRSDFHLYSRAKYGYQQIEQDALGFNGWQYVLISEGDEETNPTFELVPMDSNLKALEYKIIYHSFGFGGRFDWSPLREVRLSVGLMPQLVYLQDRDDHVLRNKLSIARGFGLGGEGDAVLSYSWGEDENYRPYVSLRAQLKYIWANTEQTQEWYDSEPNTGEDETGLRYTGITHIVESLQVDLSLSAGVWYW